ncbi:MAG: aminotransferase class V-fold PLP-dependent enzyme [Clostridia bacterium]|nr:aminotransferase class V-fold PLP-dependent enzyme [Clostridia bacterium]
MRPIFTMLKEASGRLSGHMPGHKGRNPFEQFDPYTLDTTELPTTDDLYAADSGIARAQQLYARAAGAGDTIFLHNGSTAGIHAMLQLYAGEGDKALLPRNAHLSAANGCILGGIDAVWMPFTQRADGYCYMAEETVLAMLDAHPDAKVLLLTRPDFYGCCIPLERIVKKAHGLGIRVVVDEAHGAHLPWLDYPSSAGTYGVDAWTQSVHKTLPGLTGTAVLHLRDAADHGKAMRILRREQTSSPNFVMLMTIDDSRAFMEEKGAKQLAEVADMADVVRA